MIRPPDTITADASVDVTGPLNTWLASLETYTTVQFDPAAQYRCESALRLPPTIWVDAQGAQMIRTTHNWDRRQGVAHVLARNAHRATLTGLHIIGPKDPAGGYQPATEGQHGIHLAGSVGVMIADCRIEHVHGDLVYIGSTDPHKAQGSTPAQPSIWTWNTTLSGLTGRDAGRHGLCVTACDGLTATGLDFANVNRHPYHREPRRASDGWRNLHVGFDNRLGELTTWPSDPQRRPRRFGIPMPWPTPPDV